MGLLAREIPPALTDGDLEVLGVLPNASNATFLARTSGPEGVLAVYKPRAGERTLWDFPEGTLCQREVAAYRVARQLGWPRVPPTVLRDGPLGEGSVQLFIDADINHNYFTLRQERDEDFRRIALFDLAINNADRKGGHCLIDAEDRLWAVDHGVCFSSDPKLRTVIWDFVGEPIPDHLARDLKRLSTGLAEGIYKELSELLLPDELDGLLRRADELTQLGRFPEPGPGRPFPWPPV
jgi:uncharacterized repeat protein (TIGR03843 family)